MLNVFVINLFSFCLSLIWLILSRQNVVKRPVQTHSWNIVLSLSWQSVICVFIIILKNWLLSTFQRLLCKSYKRAFWCLLIISSLFKPLTLFIYNILIITFFWTLYRSCLKFEKSFYWLVVTRDKVFDWLVTGRSVILTFVCRRLGQEWIGEFWIISTVDRNIWYWKRRVIWWLLTFYWLVIFVLWIIMLLHRIALNLLLAINRAWNVFENLKLSTIYFQVRLVFWVLFDFFV